MLEAIVMHLAPLTLAASGIDLLREQSEEIGSTAPASGIAWAPVALVLAAVIVFSLVTFFVIPAIIARRGSAPMRRRAMPRPPARVRARARPAPATPAPMSGADAAPDAFIPINLHCVPSAGFLSRRLRNAAQAKAAARPQDKAPPPDYLSELEARLAEQEQQITSQQERLAWMEDRLQTMSMEVRALRQMLHQQGGRPAARPATTPWRLPLVGGGQNRIG